MINFEGQINAWTAANQQTHIKTPSFNSKWFSENEVQMNGIISIQSHKKIISAWLRNI